MRFPTPTLGLLLLPVLAATLHARIGESQDEFERRLFQPNVGKFALRERGLDPFQEAEQLRQQPFHTVRARFPEDLRERKYWKSAVPNVLSNDNGWFVHVFYQDGVSVMEAYQRVGEPLNQFEIQNILAVNQGRSQWREVEIDAVDTAIGGNFQLVDDSRRALRRGDWLVVFSGDFDRGIKARILAGEAASAASQAERRRRQMETAPGSTAGF
ncbi:MAG: hypothetical protein ABII82_00810 [Verrucomicrobiota bacterium]